MGIELPLEGKGGAQVHVFVLQDLLVTCFSFVLQDLLPGLDGVAELLCPPSGELPLPHCVQ